MIQLYKNRHLGERCVLICNGPSLNKMDFSLIRNETCIGCNKIFLGFKKFLIYPKYFVAVNEKVLRQSEHAINGLTCVKFLSNRCPGLFLNDSLTHIVGTMRPSLRFSKDIEQGIHEGWTVTYAALQIAYYLGFKKVVLIGMDHRFNYSGAPNEASILHGDDPNHFSNAYFGGGQEWDNPDLVSSEKSYRIARKIYEEDGREIVDATIEGACDIFKKMTLKESLQNY